MEQGIGADLELIDVGLVGFRVAAGAADRIRDPRRPIGAVALLEREVHAVELRAAVVDALIHGVAERTDAELAGNVLQIGVDNSSRCGWY